MKSFPYILWKYAHTWASDFKCSNIVLASPLNSYNTKSIVILHFRSKLILSTYFIYIVRYNLHYYWLCIFWECINTSADHAIVFYRNCPQMWILPHIEGQGVEPGISLKKRTSFPELALLYSSNEFGESFNNNCLCVCWYFWKNCSAFLLCCVP